MTGEFQNITIQNIKPSKSEGGSQFKAAILTDSYLESFIMENSLIQNVELLPSHTIASMQGNAVSGRLTNINFIGCTLLSDNLN